MRFKKKNKTNVPESAKFSKSDIVEITEDKGQRRLLVIRQFEDYDRLIVSITSIVDVISEIKLTAFTPFSHSGSAFSFPTINDFLRFAKRADPRLNECVDGLKDKGEEVKDEDLAHDILQYFDKDNIRIVGIFETWERETRHINQSGVKSGYYNNVVNSRNETFSPADGVTTKVTVRAAYDQLLGVNISIDRLRTEISILARTIDDISVLDTHAAMSLQKAMGTTGINIYNVLIDKYAPFNIEQFNAFRLWLDRAHIKYIYKSSPCKAETKKLWHRIDFERDQNLEEHNGYVPYGASHVQYIEIEYISDVVISVTYEDRDTESGYWHDNPNYPFSKISSLKIIVDDATNMAQFISSLGVIDASPKALLDKMSSSFSTQREFIKYLDEHNITYSTSRS